MALKKPLVLASGQIQQLQSTDVLDSPQSGGDIVSVTNANSGSIVIGAPVYVSTNDQVDKARANASGTTRVFGLVRDASIATSTAGIVQTGGILSATTGQWDTITGGSGGLVAGTVYYLDPSTAGKLTSTAPTTVGQYVEEVGFALSTTEMDIDPKAPILL